MGQSREKWQELVEKASKLPLRPGVYIMKNSGGTVIYVGKSSALRNRVSQYFHQDFSDAPKTAKMVSQIDDFEYILTDTEIEALALENSLIKQFSPKYNIKLKDAKSYPYIKVTMQNAFPRLLMTRKRTADGAKYFGPFSGTSTVYEIIRTLEKTLRLPKCKRSFPRDIGKERPCMYHQLGWCVGVCTGEISSEEYRAIIRSALPVLRGHTREAITELEREMLQAAEEERYEAAARCRDSIASFRKLGEKQKILSAPDDDFDVISVYRGELSSALSVFYIRGGALYDKASFAFSAAEITDIEEGGLSSFISALYAVRDDIPGEILVNFDLAESDRELLTSYLSQKAGRKVVLRRPVRGDGVRLANLVADNAKEAAESYVRARERDDELLVTLASLLALEVVPERIEAYDVSNFGAEQITVGMIVLENGSFKKKDYRAFGIHAAAQDDYGAMREAIARRMAHLSDEGGAFSVLPDLILLDGGRAHVSVVRALLDELGLDIPVFGMVKDDTHKTRALTTDTDEISIHTVALQSVYQFIYKIQEEVHRFTISKMSAGKRKKLKTSSIEKISGIGPAKAKALLAHFGSLSRLREADAETLCRVPGIGMRDAEAIRSYFGKNNKSTATNKEETP